MLFANIPYYEEREEVFYIRFPKLWSNKIQTGQLYHDQYWISWKKCIAVELSYLAQKSVYFRDVLIVKYGFICIRKTEIMTNFALPNLEWESIGNNNR